MARRSTLKAADVDREHVAERLRQATAEGRLTAEELEDRLATGFRARTYGELDALVADLPGPTPARTRRGQLAPRISTRNPLAVAIAVPVALAVVAVVVFVLSGVLVGWLLWMAAGWWFVGHKRRVYHAHHARYGHSRDGRGSWQASSTSTQTRSGYWV
jgi:hypothetical protein